MFCKSGILIFIFAENNYTMLIKTPLLHQSSCPCVFLSLSFSLSLSGYFFGVQRPSEFSFLPGLLRPSREGVLHLHPIERAPEASVNRASPVSGTLLAFCVNQGISASFSLLYFLIGRLWTTRLRSIKGPQHVSIKQMSNRIDRSQPFWNVLFLRGTLCKFLRWVSRKRE